MALIRRDELDATRVQLGDLTLQQLAMRRLEAEESGITKVNWGPDGAVHLDKRCTGSSSKSFLCQTDRGFMNQMSQTGTLHHCGNLI